MFRYCTSLVQHFTTTILSLYFARYECPSTHIEFQSLPKMPPKSEVIEVGLAP